MISLLLAGLVGAVAFTAFLYGLEAHKNRHRPEPRLWAYCPDCHQYMGCWYEFDAHRWIGQHAVLHGRMLPPADRYEKIPRTYQ